MSNAGKSLIVAGLCRVFKQDGYKVVPFKSQNMALNSFITEDGLEMGRAQVMQAEAAGVKPNVYMNPILLKPTTNMGSQIIVNGEVYGNMSARDYFKFKTSLKPHIMTAFAELEKEADIIVIEGAGSPAEINLKENDIVNMGLAKMVDSPVLLVGDIDRGGVFAQLVGTIMLLEEDERQRVKGLVINKFRGDKTILDPGIDMLEGKCNIKVAGVVPYMNVKVEDEDSLSDKLLNKTADLIDIGVIRLPKISNFTDFDVFNTISGVSVRYIDSIREFGTPDMVILPGSKNTMADLKWLRQSGLEAKVKRAALDVPVFGICGGYQMLGMEISDPDGVEGGGYIRGMEFLNESTVLMGEKTRTQTEGKIGKIDGIFSELSGKEYIGYEIHMGITNEYEPSENRVENRNENRNEKRFENVIHKCLNENSNVYGTYIHGIFDKGDIAMTIVKALAEKKGISLDMIDGYDYQQFKETQYNLLADGIRQSMDMDYIYEIMGIKKRNALPK